MLPLACEQPLLGVGNGRGACSQAKLPLFDYGDLVRGRGGGAEGKNPLPRNTSEDLNKLIVTISAVSVTGCGRGDRWCSSKCTTGTHPGHVP